MKRSVVWSAWFWILTWLSAGTVGLYGQNCASCRYVTQVFDSVTIIKNVKFGQGVNASDQNQELFMDVYLPFGDTAAQRPILMFAFGGAFIQGKKDDRQIVEACKRFARAGYVAASIDYRIVNVNTIASQLLKYSVDEILTRTFFMPMQDLRASIQYMKAHRAELGNEWRLDTSKIFISGVSSGGITALNVAYCNRPEELADMKGLGGIDDLGGFYATSGLYPSYSWRPTAVISIAGALYNPKWLEPGEPPVISVQGDQDDVVPYKTGNLGVAGIVNIPLSGSFVVDSIARARGVCTHLYTIPGAKHDISQINPIYFEYIFHEFLPRVEGMVYGRSYCSEGILEASITPGGVVLAQAGDPLTFTANLSGSAVEPQVRWCSAPCSLTSTERIINPIAAPNQYFILLANTTDRQATTFVTVTNDSSLVSTSRGTSLQGSLGMRLWPNPSLGKVNVWVEASSGRKDLRLEVLNLAGQRQAVIPVSEGNNPNLSLFQLPAGVYLCRLVSETGEAGPHQKLILTR